MTNVAKSSSGDRGIGLLHPWPWAPFWLLFRSLAITHVLMHAWMGRSGFKFDHKAQFTSMATTRKKEKRKVKRKNKNTAAAAHGTNAWGRFFFCFVIKRKTLATAATVLVLVSHRVCDVGKKGDRRLRFKGMIQTHF